MPDGREWTTFEVAALRRGYATGLTAADIGSILQRSERAVYVKAQKLGIKHKHGDAKEAVRIFEEQRGCSLLSIAQQYQRRRLSRADLAADIGIYGGTLKRLLPPDLWQSWPHNTVGRQLASEQRRA